MAAQLEINMRSFSYDGENIGFSFQKFVNLHKGQNGIFNGLMKYGYSEFDDNSKVRILMNGVNTNTLGAYKADILDISDIWGDFDIVVSHFLDFIAMAPFLQKNSTAKLASVTGSGGRRGYGRIVDRVSGVSRR